jgi:hypothetical protein
VAKVQSGEIELEEMTAHASTLMYVSSQYIVMYIPWLIIQPKRIAGGETTATSLAATLYYVLKTPDVLAKLTDTIRARYKTYGEIDATTALQLPYLQAVIKEALRMHPSGAHGFPRISPGATVDGHWVPAGVSPPWPYRRVDKACQF